jgi:di-heme oxidoreductase (putative peroxidase)
MMRNRAARLLVLASFVGVLGITCIPAVAQLIDRTLSPNAANAGIAKSFEQQAGAGRGDVLSPGSSLFIINRDPARAIRRGRQIFQRKFTRSQGQGPVTGDGSGNPAVDLIIGAGLVDSCAGCHGRPRGSAGSGGDVVTRPDSRDAPHLFGLGLKEMLGDQITADLRRIRTGAIDEARATGRNSTKLLRVSVTLATLDYGSITARPNGSVDTSQVRGVDTDLRVRPFFLHGGTISIREFLVGAFNAEMGLEAPDPDLVTASGGGRVVTPSGMVLDGSSDAIEAPPVSSPLEDSDHDGVTNEIPTSIVDFMEFYLLHYFKAGIGEQNATTAQGRNLMQQIGCTACHVPDMVIARDRRVADLDTVFDAARGNPFNRLFATASLQLQEINDASGFPSLKRPLLGSFVVRNIFTDFKRHDLGLNFHEVEYSGNLRREFLTTALWGVGSTGPYGHDGRSMTLEEVIRRHGGEALQARNNFVALSAANRNAIFAFLNSLILFPPDDTASTLDPGNPADARFPQFAHGSIRLGALFNDPTDPE